MIIPVRCFTCGNVIADKWQEYERRVQKQLQNPKKSADGDDASRQQGPSSASQPDQIVLDSFRGAILDDLGLHRICCRRHMLTHVDLIDII